MTSWLNFFYAFISGAALLIIILGEWFIAILPGIEPWDRRFFRSYFFVLMLTCLSTGIEMVFYYYPNPGSFTGIYVMWCLESLFLSLTLPMLTVYLLHCCGENMRESRLLRTVLGLLAVFFGLIVISPLVGNFASVTPDMQFKRSSIYPLLIIPLIVIMLLNLTGVIQRRKQLSPKIFSAFLIAILPMTFALLMQLFINVFSLLDICVVVSALCMYGFVLSDQIERDLRYQQEIANQRASIMVLQMRPHFIYNTMTSVYCLCNQDPEKARQVVMDFTTYLRRNFTAIASSDPIPFSAELEHTRAYLAVEQAQYEDSLLVDYDTPHTLFRLPPLTLQPIVENAVKHGRNPDADPLHISIRTRKTDAGSEIVVADNGSGYAPDDSEPQIALKNIQERLKLMCGGQLTITSGDRSGTVVTITIPEKS